MTSPERNNVTCAEGLVGCSPVCVWFDGSVLVGASHEDIMQLTLRRERKVQPGFVAPSRSGIALRPRQSGRRRPKGAAFPKVEDFVEAALAFLSQPVVPVPQPSPAILAVNPMQTFEQAGGPSTARSAGASRGAKNPHWRIVPGHVTLGVMPWMVNGFRSKCRQR